MADFSWFLFPCTPSFLKICKNIFPTILLTDQIVIAICIQKTKFDVFSWSEEVAREKDVCLERVYFLLFKNIFCFIF